MTKQEEVREILEGISSGGLSIDEGLRELDIVGVVIKIDRELPDTTVFIKSLLESDLPREKKVEALKKHTRDLGLEEDGYVEVERLIRLCARCGAKRTDDVDSDICGNCADDLRSERDAEV